MKMVSGAEFPRRNWGINYMAITITGLKKIYAAPDGTTVPVIDVEELHIGDGEQIGLIGSSGSGKTTLLHLIAGILTPDSGKIICDFAAEVPAPSGGSDGPRAYRSNNPPRTTCEPRMSCSSAKPIATSSAGGTWDMFFRRITCCPVSRRWRMCCSE